MARYPIDTLTVYEEDDETVLFEVSTDPAHQAPYLKPFDNYPEQTVDFAKSTVSISQQNVQVVDVPRDSTDQNTGYMTGMLADPTGSSQINGHRAVTKQDVGSGPELILDGVVRAVTLLDTFSGFQLELRDIRERERQTRIFERTDTPTILPRGVLNGWGITGRGGTRFPVPPTEPLAAVYESTSSISGRFRMIDATHDPRLIMDDAMREALTSLAPYPDQPETLVFDRWKVKWRLASGGPWITISNVRYLTFPFVGDTTGVIVQPYAGRDVVSVFGVDNLLSGATLPSDHDEVDFLVQYDGPVTKEWPLHIQDLTVGEFIRNGYRGDYSYRDPRLRYDEDVILALSTPIRAIIDKPEDDLRDVMEKHAYPIEHAAPILNALGEISPVTYLLPDETVELPVISNSNAKPDAGGWSHGVQDAINIVQVVYKRDFAKEKPQRGSVAPPEMFTIENRLTVWSDEQSIALIGEHKLELSPLLLRTIGQYDGSPRTGDVLDETAVQVALRVGYMALDRFLLGGQYFSLLVRRTDADMESLVAGKYAEVGVSWHPDYNTGERGSNRLAQVISRKNVNAAWARLMLIDAGSANAPLGQPTLGVVTVDDDGVVHIPVDAMAEGSQARVDYAISNTEPDPSSGLWTFLARVRYLFTGVPKNLTTPPVASGAIVWIRCRGEGVGRRPSVWTTAVSVNVPSVPRLTRVSLTIGDDCIPSVSWETNDQVLGVRINYEAHLTSDVATLPDSVDVDASDGSYEFTSLRVPRGKTITVVLEPWTGWTGASVSGTEGDSVEKRLNGEVEPVAPWVQSEFDRDAEEETASLTLVIRDPAGAVTSVEFSKREGTKSGSAFGPWLSSWDSGPSTPPFSGTYVESISVPGGEESSVKWRVTFLDVSSVSRTIGGTHATSQIDEFETQVRVMLAGGILNPDYDNVDATALAGGGGVVQPDALDEAVEIICPILLTVGGEIVGFRGRLYNASGAAFTFSSVALYEVDEDGGLNSLSELNSTGLSSGWMTLEYLLLSETVSDNTYVVYGDVSIPTASGDDPEDVRILWAEVDLIRHTQRE